MNLDRGRECRPNAARSVLKTEVKIFPHGQTKLGKYRVNKPFNIWPKIEPFIRLMSARAR